MDRFSGKPAIVSYEDWTDGPIEVKVDFLSQEQFKVVLSQYPREVGRLFDGFTPEKWRDYQNITKPLNMSDKCILLFRESESRVEVLIHSLSRADVTLEYIETSKEKFEKWRDKKSLLYMVRYYSQLREYTVPHFTGWSYSDFDKSNFWKNINTNVSGIVEDYNCIVMLNRSKFVCTNKLSKEDVDFIFDKVKTKYLKTYFKNK